MKKSAALLFLSLIVMSMGGCGNSQNVPTQQPAENTITQTAPSQSTAQTSEPQSTAQPDTTQQQKNASGKISLAMYEQIDTGMRYEDVIALIGAKPSSESTMIYGCNYCYVFLVGRRRHWCKRNDLFPGWRRFKQITGRIKVEIYKKISPENNVFSGGS